MLENSGLFDKSPIIAIEWADIDLNKIKHVTENIKSLTGFEAQEIKEKKQAYLNLVDKKTRKEMRTEYLDHLKKGLHEFNLSTYRVKKKDGSFLWVDTTVHLSLEEDGSLKHLIWYLIDVTKYKVTDFNLREAEKKYNIISESTMDGIFVLDKLGYMIFTNQGMLNITGRTIDTMLGVHFSKYVPKKELPRYLKKLKDVFIRKEIRSFITQIIHFNGHLVDVEINGKLVKQNGVWVAQGSMRDITYRKEMTRHLKRSQERFRIMFENNPTPTVFGDFSLLEQYFFKIKKEQEINMDYMHVRDFLKFVDLNHAAMALYSCKDKKELLASLSDRFDPSFYDLLVVKLMELWNRSDDHFDIATFIKTRRNKKKSVILSFYRLPNMKDKSFQFLISLKDVTQKDRVEDSFIRNQKLNTLGEMASSVSHEFNNSLQAILGNLELISFDKAVSRDTHHQLERVKELIRDASHRISVLQRFGGKSEVIVYKTIHVRELIEEVIEKFTPLWKANLDRKSIQVDVEIRCAEEHTVMGNPGEIYSVLENMLKNAYEAMPKGGSILFDVYMKDDDVYINVKDTGQGMDEETQAKMLQAFYTTKGFDLGRGLGMSGAYRIVKEHDGDIFIRESRVGRGSTVCVKLPSTRSEYQNPQEEELDLSLHEANKELRILWVDDELTIRLVVEQYFQLLEYNGDVAENGFEALDLMKEHHYDLVITDIGMPNMNGWQLIERIRKTYGQGIKIVVVSGWSLDIGGEEREKYNIYEVLKKPIEFKKLEEIFESL